MSEHSLHFFFGSPFKVCGFVQLSGLLPTDPAAQEHEWLSRAIELGLTF